MNVYPVADLRSAVELVAALRSANPPQPLKVDPSVILSRTEHYSVDFKEVRDDMKFQRFGDCQPELSMINSFFAP